MVPREAQMNAPQIRARACLCVCSPQHKILNLICIVPFAMMIAFPGHGGWGLDILGAIIQPTTATRAQSTSKGAGTIIVCKRGVRVLQCILVTGC